MTATQLDAERPVYWAVQYRAAGALVQTRMTHERCSSRKRALMMTFGFESSSPSFTFHNLGTTLTGARKIIRKESL